MKKTETKEEGLKRFTFDPAKDIILNLPNYLNHPFFQKKAEASRKTIEKYDLSAQILKLQNDKL